MFFRDQRMTSLKICNFCLQNALMCAFWNWRRFLACSANLSEIPMKIHDFQKFHGEENFLGSSLSEIHSIFWFFLACSALLSEIVLGTCPTCPTSNSACPNLKITAQLPIKWWGHRFTTKKWCLKMVWSLELQNHVLLLVLAVLR